MTIASKRLNAIDLVLDQDTR